MVEDGSLPLLLVLFLIVPMTLVTRPSKSHWSPSPIRSTSLASHRDGLINCAAIVPRFPARHPASAFATPHRLASRDSIRSRINVGNLTLRFLAATIPASHAAIAARTAGLKGDDVCRKSTAFAPRCNSRNVRQVDSGRTQRPPSLRDVAPMDLGMLILPRVQPAAKFRAGSQAVMTGWRHRF